MIKWEIAASQRALLLLIFFVMPVLIVNQLPAGQSVLPEKYRVSPFQAGSSLWSVDMLHLDTAMTVGDRGIIKKTVSGGSDWMNFSNSSTTSQILLGVEYIDSSHAVAVGHAGT